MFTKAEAQTLIAAVARLLASQTIPAAEIARRNAVNAALRG